MKNKFAIILLFLISVPGFSNEYQKRYIKGNLNEKTAVVTESSGTADGLEVTNLSLQFILESKQILGYDRDLEALATATILSIPENYGETFNDKEKLKFINTLLNIYKNYDDSLNVQTAILNKCKTLKNHLPMNKFTDSLNTYLLKNDLDIEQAEKIKAILECLKYIGNNTSYTILSTFYISDTYEKYNSEIESTLVQLVPVSNNSIIYQIKDCNLNNFIKIYRIVKKNNEIPVNFSCDIAENVLKKTILLIGNSSELNQELVTIQLDSLKILSDNKWTRASATAISFFEQAKIEYKNKILNEVQFNEIIAVTGNVAPIDYVKSLVLYLEELNSNKEHNISVSTEVVLTVINTLGALGNKSAFDSLLAVTYLSYPENVLTAARQALAGLKW